jgi:acyl-homoserine-lactone acylase
MRFFGILATGTVAAFVLAAGHAPALAKNSNYHAQLQRTSYGIPHVKAEDWGSLGYGYGYVFAQDNACVLAREVLAAAGTQARWFGPGTNNSLLAADVTYRMVNSTARLANAWNDLDIETRDLLTGYAAGYNRYVRDTGAAGLAADCRNQPWVRDITHLDVLGVLRKLMVRASTGQFTGGLLAAVAPPMPSAWTSVSSVGELYAGRAETGPVTVDPAELPDWSPERFGSNALALGSDLTGGAGALLGNPHFPWNGIERFYPVHLTIPGRYDVMGASIYGFPMVNIGFNRHVAWSHTVSTARRFVLRELTLAPGNPRAYVYEGSVVPMQEEPITVQVLQGSNVVNFTHSVWHTQFGPVVVPASIAPWTTTRAYALTDANLENARGFAMYRELGSARSVPEIDSILRRYVAMPWVNTIAADAQGNAYYADLSVVPNVTNAQLNDADCRGSPTAQGLSATRTYTLNGALAKCDPGTDADSPVPGIFGAGNLPSLLRRDYVHNANDSYWLTHPEERLEGYSRLIGADEGQRQGFRTRVGHDQVNARMAGTDGLPGTGFTRQWLQDVLYSNRHYSADIMLDGVLTLCSTQSNLVTVAGQANPVDVSGACGVLASWDRRNRTESVGAHVWGELWARIAGNPAGGSGLPNVSAVLYAVPFDVADPVNTPRGLNVGNAQVVQRVMGELGRTVVALQGFGIPLNRPWGEVQYDTRHGVRIPVHGGSGGSGVWNAISTPSLNANGYTPIVAGSSYIQAVTFRDSGPDARAIVTYSVSTDPANPHYADMTHLYSDYGWVRMPYAERDIRQDPNLQSLTISEKKK